MKCNNCEKFNKCLNSGNLRYDDEGNLENTVETESCFSLKGVSENIEPCFLCGSMPKISADTSGDISVWCEKHSHVFIRLSFPTTFSYAICRWNKMIKKKRDAKTMSDLELVKRLRGCADWFRKHGRNTNSAVISVCEDAADRIELYYKKEI